MQRSRQSIRLRGSLKEIRTNDPSFYDAGGFKARKYKNSSKPKDIPSICMASNVSEERRASIADEHGNWPWKKRKRNAPEE